MAALAALTTIMLANPSAAVQNETAPKVGGWFQWCEYRDTSHDDPIVYRGEPGAAHRHIEFGNDINAFSTRASLMKQPSSCHFKDGTTRGNHSAYWVQDLRLHDGSHAGGLFSTAYYSAWDGVNPSAIGLPPGASSTS